MADNSIIVKNPYHTIAHDEGDAGGAITPGHLIAQAADGDWEVNGVAADSDAEPVFADLNVDPQDDKNDAYAAGERVRFFYALPGMELDVLCSANENVSVGDTLIPAADGTFTVKAADTTEDDSRVMLKATEAATDTADFRCHARVI